MQNVLILRMKYVTPTCFVDCYTNLPMYKFHIVQEQWPYFNNIIIIQKIVFCERLCKQQNGKKNVKNNFTFLY
jgi:hypothetical protein